MSIHQIVEIRRGLTGHPVTSLAGHDFASPAQAQAYFVQEVLEHHAAFDTRGTPLGPNALKFVTDALRTLHMFSASWDGVTSGRVVMQPRGHRSIELTYVDGRTRWAAIDRMFGAGKGPRERFGDALRAIVKPDTERVRELYFLSPGPHHCPILSTPIAPDTSEVDHAPPWPFASIAACFFHEHVLHASPQIFTPPDTILTRHARTQPQSTHVYDVLPLAAYAPHPSIDTTVFGETVLRHDVMRGFREYHKLRASLRVVSTLANRVVLPAIARGDQ